MTEIPLGQRENERLEFKGAKAVEDKKKIARLVVGMLNALPEGETGEVWIGLTDQGDVASGVERIERIEEERTQLLDVLMGRIEPNITSDEVRVEVVGDALPVLRVQVRSKVAKRPYCVMTGGQRDYVIRVGARNRPMTREEILGRNTMDDDTVSDVRQQVQNEADQLLASEQTDLFWLRLVPTQQLALRTQDPSVQSLLVDLAQTGFRQSRWVISDFHHVTHTPSVLRGETELAPGLKVSIEIERAGGITYMAHLRYLKNPVPFQHLQSQPPAVHPRYLATSVIRVVRIARELWCKHGRLANEAQIITRCALLDIRGWTVVQPDRLFPIGGQEVVPYPHRDMPILEFRDFSARDLCSNPDLLGYEILKAIHAEFGLSEETVMELFDENSMRLVLPE